jgi:DNA-binding transcriptional LysR family regulator
MELRELKYIIQISESGSLTKAASDLFIAQSSLSSFLKKYEKNLGYKLFVRTSKGLILTSEGEVFLVYAKNMLERKRKLMNELSDISNLKIGHIKFAISPYRAPYLLPSLLVKWKELYPNIQIEIIESHIHDQVALLHNNTVDLGFLINKKVDDDLVYRNIFEEELLIGAHPSFGLREKAYKKKGSEKWRIEMNEIKDKPYLLYSNKHSLNKITTSIFNKHNIIPKVEQTHDNFVTILRLAEKGVGITFVPHIYKEYHKNLEYYSIGDEGSYRTLALGYPSSGYLSNATIEFSNLIEKILNNPRI